jgi:hypothetical protein
MSDYVLSQQSDVLAQLATNLTSEELHYNHVTFNSTRSYANAELTSSQRFLNQRIVSFSPKKCFICLAVFEFNDAEYQIIRNYFTNKNFNLLDLNNKEKTMRLIVLMNKFVLSVCKCRRKLAHLECFNNYVDVKQDGNINIAIVCTQCQYEYDFEYPYNSNYTFLMR